MSKTTAYVPTQYDKALAQKAKEAGCPYQAKYILTFGADMLEPGRIRTGIIPAHEDIYKKMVDEGHPWDWYTEYPEGTEF